MPLAPKPLLTATTEIAVATARTLTDIQQHELRTMWLHATQRDTYCIGWLPKKCWDVRHEQGDTSAVYRNGDLVGWAMHTRSRSRGVMKIYQIWVRPDARILEHGRALTTKIAADATDQHCYQIEAWVAEDIEANFFWPQVGFTRTVWKLGRGDHPRRLYLWIAKAENFSDNFSLCAT
jgi:ribosomal protein S18 acetylase RimI-like enzyme